MKILLLPFKFIIWLYVALTGCIVACTFGIIDKYSPEHKRFLMSGFICGSCKRFLLNKKLMADVIAKDEEGNEVPALEIRARAKYFCCPKCNHKWKLRKEEK